MTPEAFSAAAIAWIDAVSSIGIHLATKLAIIAALPAYVQLRNRLDRHRAEIDQLKPAAPSDGAPQTCTREHQCAAPGAGPCNGFPRVHASGNPP